MKQFLPVDRNDCYPPIFSVAENMMTPFNANKLPTVLLKETNELLAGKSRKPGQDRSRGGREIATEVQVVS